MYNGIGLSTVRGSGTSGYVQRNLSHVPATKERQKINYKTEADLQKEEKVGAANFIQVHGHFPVGKVTCHRMKLQLSMIRLLYVSDTRTQPRHP